MKDQTGQQHDLSNLDKILDRDRSESQSVQGDERIPLIPRQSRWPVRLLAAIYIVEIPTLLLWYYLDDLAYAYMIHRSLPNGGLDVWGLSLIGFLGLQTAVLISIAVCITVREFHKVAGVGTKILNSVVFTLFGYAFYTALFMVAVAVITIFFESWGIPLP